MLTCSFLKCTQCVHTISLVSQSLWLEYSSMLLGAVILYICLCPWNLILYPYLTVCTDSSLCPLDDFRFGAVLSYMTVKGWVYLWIMSFGVESHISVLTCLHHYWRMLSHFQSIRSDFSSPARIPVSPSTQQNFTCQMLCQSSEGSHFMGTLI